MYILFNISKYIKLFNDFQFLVNRFLHLREGGRAWGLWRVAGQLILFLFIFPILCREYVSQSKSWAFFVCFNHSKESPNDGNFSAVCKCFCHALWFNLSTWTFVSFQFIVHVVWLAVKLCRVPSHLVLQRKKGAKTVEVTRIALARLFTDQFGCII